MITDFNIQADGIVDYQHPHLRARMKTKTPLASYGCNAAIIILETEDSKTLVCRKTEWNLDAVLKYFGDKK